MQHRFMQQLFDGERQAKHAAEIGQAMLAAQLIRLTAIAAKMPGNREARAKRIQRFLQVSNLRENLWQLFQET